MTRRAMLATVAGAAVSKPGMRALSSTAVSANDFSNRPMSGIVTGLYGSYITLVKFLEDEADDA